MSGVFNYQNPAVIRWGADSLAHLEEELERLGVHRPFVVTTRSVEANSAIMQRLSQAAGRPLAGTFGSVGQHAPQGDVEAALSTAGSANPDGIVSVGGGSPIDAAKVIALRLGGETALPHVAVPTTLSVAELAGSAGMTDPAGRKGGLRDERLIPRAVIYDGALALHTPLSLWLSTGIRALDHAVEGILVPGEHPYADALALEGIRRLFRSLPEAKAKPTDAAARTQNQLGAWFSYTLTEAAAGLSHAMGKQIGSPYGIPHGVTSCLLLPHVMRYRAAQSADRLAMMAPAMGVPADGRDVQEQAAAAADAVYELIRQLGLPQHLDDYHLTEQQLREAAEPLARHYPLEDLVAIYRAAA